MKNNTLRQLFSWMAPAAILFLAPALRADPSISLQPSSSIVTVGDTFTLNLMANNLALGAYDVTFSYGPLMVFIDEGLVTFDVHLGGPDNSFPLVSAGLDTLEVAEVSFLTNAADLAALQTDSSFPLAHIQVKALRSGTAAFDFVTTPFTAVSDYSGTPITGLAYQGTSVLIEDAEGPPPPPVPGEVPEPSSIILLVSSIFLVLAARRRRPALKLSA